MDICISGIRVLISTLLLQTSKLQSQVNLLYFNKLISPNRKSTFSIKILKARCNAAVSLPKKDTSKKQRGVRRNIYQLLDFGLRLVGYTRRPQLYYQRTKIGKWRRKENSSVSRLAIKFPTWTSNIKPRSYSRWWRQTLTHSDESKFLRDDKWRIFIDLKAYDKQCVLCCLCSGKRTCFPTSIGANVNNKPLFSNSLSYTCS